jgi:hypothetical protein
MGIDRMRIEVWYDEGVHEVHPDGDYVYYEDHLEEMKKKDEYIRNL